MSKYFEIDILMTIHNGDKYLTQTINSLKSQKYKRWNLIIINNYSSDNTSKLLNKINKISKKIKVFNTNHDSNIYILISSFYNLIPSIIIN